MSYYPWLIGAWIALALLGAIPAGALPDLTVEEIEVFCTGENTLFLAVTIRNSGTVTASNFPVSIFLSTDPIITFTDVLVRTATVASVGPTSSTRVTGFAGVPMVAMPGVYYAGAFVDSTFRVAESDETNNITTGNLVEVPCVAGAPDIRVDARTLEFIEESGAKGLLQEGDAAGILLQNRRIDTQHASEPGAVAGYVFVQLDDGASPEIIASVGGTILHPVPVRAFAVHFPQPTTLGGISGIAWAGPLLPSDKISPYIAHSKSANAYLVDVFPNVTRAAAVERLSGAGTVDESADLGTTTFLLRDVGSIETVAAIDEVSWIAPAPEAVVAGLPVLVCPDPMTEYGPRPKFELMGVGWDGIGRRGTAMSYYFQNGTADVPGDLEKYEVLRALSTWTEVIDVAVSEAGGPGEPRCIEVGWYTGHHGDGIPFDGPGGVVGHAFYPSHTVPEQPFAGDVHFDDAEYWQIGTGIDVYSVALHELGHSLGLGHSADPTAIMFGVYVPGKIHGGLKPDDLAGILTLYPPTLQWDQFRINNDGPNSLTVYDIYPSLPAPWITIAPSPPFQIPAYSSTAVQVAIDFDRARSFLHPSRSLVVESNDAAKSPYPHEVPVHITPAFRPDLPVRMWPYGVAIIALVIVVWLRRQRLNHRL